MVSSPDPAARHIGGDHLELGELADEIAGVAAPAVAEHLVSCRACSDRLSALTTASISVTRDLRADPEPELPPSVAARVAEAIAAESATRAARSPAGSTPVTAAAGPPLRTGRRRDGWWARHTRLGGVLVTAAALVVVGSGGVMVAKLAGDRTSNGQTAAGIERSSSRPDAATTSDPSPLSGGDTSLRAAGGAIALHRAAFAGEVGDILSAGTRTAVQLTSKQETCATKTLAATDLGGASLTALSGGFTLDGIPVLVVVAEHDGSRTAVAISGCSTRPQVAARGDLS